MMEIIVDKLSYTYSPGTAYACEALKNISLKIGSGEFIGIIGHTGSGKSTFIQHLNGLIKATSGGIYCNGEDIYDKDFNMPALRSKIGMVFQYPEYQLFEVTVFEDVKFGPKAQGLSDKEAAIRAYEALEAISFPRELTDQSPFDLSGGQKRLAAIAGVLAMKPEVLILDEPTAGLDPRTREDILERLKALHDNTGTTIILVSHSMEEIAGYVKRILVMGKGQILYDDVPVEIFSHIEELEALGLKAPEVSYILRDLRAAGLNVPITSLTYEEAAYQILKALKNKNA